jgi:hypothetical protein
MLFVEAAREEELAAEGARKVTARRLVTRVCDE